jgi:hypothetical protein
MRPELINWFRSFDTGLSSMAIVSHMEGMLLPDVLRYGYNHPLDPSDFGRCYRLMLLLPEYRTRIQEMAQYSKAWELLTAHWDELERLYLVGLARTDNKAPELYERMTALRDEARTHDHTTE